ncbi:cyclic peptide export ABC transporter, partial [Pseudoalteromonas piscicida]
SPSNGFIKVDDFAVTESNLDDYRSKITMVLPDFYLYKELLDGDGHPVDLKKANMLLEQFQLSHKLSIDQTGFT